MDKEIMHQIVEIDLETIRLGNVVLTENYVRILYHIPSLLKHVEVHTDVTRGCKVYHFWGYEPEPENVSLEKFVSNNQLNQIKKYYEVTNSEIIKRYFGIDDKFTSCKVSGVSGGSLFTFSVKPLPNKSDTVIIVDECNQNNNLNEWEKTLKDIKEGKLK